MKPVVLHQENMNRFHFFRSWTVHIINIYSTTYLSWSKSFPWFTTRAPFACERISFRWWAIYCVLKWLFKQIINSSNIRSSKWWLFFGNYFPSSTVVFVSLGYLNKAYISFSVLPNNFTLMSSISLAHFVEWKRLNKHVRILSDGKQNPNNIVSLSL